MALPFKSGAGRYCGIAPVPVNGRGYTVGNTSFSYSCADGFNLTGPSRATCDPLTGEWSATPRCSAVVETAPVHRQIDVVVVVVVVVVAGVSVVVGAVLSVWLIARRRSRASVVLLATESQPAVPFGRATLDRTYENVPTLRFDANGEIIFPNVN